MMTRRKFLKGLFSTAAVVAAGAALPIPKAVEDPALSICNAAYNDIKIDGVDITTSCSEWEAYEEQFIESMYQTYVEAQREAFGIGKAA